MPHVGARSVAGADLWRGRSPGEAALCMGRIQVRFNGGKGVSRFASAPLWPTPSPRGGARGVGVQLVARVPDGMKATAGDSPMFGPDVCPPLVTLSRDVRSEPWAGRVGGTASIRPLSCAEGLIGCCLDGWRWLSQPVSTDHGASRASAAV